MARKKALKKRGRPAAEIDPVQVAKLAAMQCTNQEIGDWFGVCEKTIRNNFSEEIKQARAGGKISLRRTQFKHADRSPAMAQFLGVQYLGQTNKILSLSARDVDEAVIKLQQIIIEEVKDEDVIRKIADRFIASFDVREEVAEGVVG